MVRKTLSVEKRSRKGQGLRCRVNAVLTRDLTDWSLQGERRASLLVVVVVDESAVKFGPEMDGKALKGIESA
jgi:hypothetical protein